jgi:hypothetical protein
LAPLIPLDWFLNVAFSLSLRKEKSGEKLQAEIVADGRHKRKLKAIESALGI